MASNEILCERIQAEHRPEDLQELCDKNVALVQWIAGMFRGLEDDEDLRQTAYEGLIRAAEAFQPGRGATFSTFAFAVIRGQIWRYLAACGQSVRLSEHRLRQIRKYQRVAADFYRDYGRQATPAEIGAALGLSPDQIEGIRSDAELLKIGSLDAALPDDPDLTLIDTIAAPDNIDNMIDQMALEAAIWPEVDRLESDQQEIILRRYKQNKSRKETAEAMQMTVSKARKTEYDALAKLRRSKRIRQLADDFIGDRVYHRTGLSYFQRTNTSEPEWIIQHLEEKGLLW